MSNEKFNTLLGAVEGLTKSYLPVARMEGGDFLVCRFDGDEGIYLWQHEVDDPPLFLARTIDDLLGQLQPVAEEASAIDPKDVVSVWISPQLRERLRNQ